MCELNEVENYLITLNLGLTADRIKECYDLITNPCSRVNTDDEQWVACDTEHELITVCNAIYKILDEECSTSDINTAIEHTCNLFTSSDVTHKPRIPFYILIINELID